MSLDHPSGPKQFTIEQIDENIKVLSEQLQQKLRNRASDLKNKRIAIDQSELDEIIKLISSPITYLNYLENLLDLGIWADLLTQEEEERILYGLDKADLIRGVKRISFTLILTDLREYNNLFNLGNIFGGNLPIPLPPPWW